MSGAFSPDWLTLREPADHAARDLGLASALAKTLERAGRPVRIVDLGCGTGSNLRALAPHLPKEQSWCLVDHDPALLGRARATLATWADEARTQAGGLSLRRNGRGIEVAFRPHDLARDLDPVLRAPVDLVTASALFDLLSFEAIERIVAAAAGHRACFLATLTYDGRETWHPPHRVDAAVQAAFLRHLAGDKGFGPAAGHRATDALAEAFRRRGYVVRTADSTWRLGPREGGLRIALAEGKAAAVTETGLVPVDELRSWHALRASDGEAEIGHTDLLALPPSLAA
jgi:SAM-dependent methyltransferase